MGQSKGETRKRYKMSLEQRHTIAMKRWLGGLITGALAIGACVLAFQHIANIFLRAETYNISFDNLLSVTAQQSINAFVHQHFNKIQHAALLCAVKKHFSCIHAISARQKRPGFVQFFVKASPPWLKLNEHVVMTAAGTIVNRTDYTYAHLMHIPTIHTSEYFFSDTIISQEFFTHMQQLDFSLFDQFIFSWHTPHELTLTDKTDAWFCILCQSARLPEKAVLAQCEQIKNAFKYNNDVVFSDERLLRQNKKKSVHNCVADVRFAHQIVITHKGELHV